MLFLGSPGLINFQLSSILNRSTMALLEFSVTYANLNDCFAVFVFLTEINLSRLVI